VAANSFKVSSGRGGFPKIRQRGEKDFNILNQSHPALILVHTLEARLGIFLQKRMRDLDHIPEFLEDDAQTMNRGRLRRLHLTVCLHRP
jgi:hypothetical protein